MGGSGIKMPFWTGSSGRGSLGQRHGAEICMGWNETTDLAQGGVLQAKGAA